MNLAQALSTSLQGVKDALPLLGGYIPIAISFGLISVQSGLTPLETILISTFLYAGASQFLLVAMIAAGSPIWLVIVMSLLINARHVVYGPNLAPYLNDRKGWWVLMHGLTDQVFALALTRLPQLDANERYPWFIGAAVLAWLSWVIGTAVGAITGDSLLTRWPVVSDVLPFALPALFLVLLLPRFTSVQWGATLIITMLAAIGLKMAELPNLSIPLAALLGGLTFYVCTMRKPL